MVTNFFLGANSSAGFRSLYVGFTDPGGLHDLMVLKGGPGVGKSSLMKYIGRQAEAKGEDVEYIWCSGDPESLDGVRLPRIGVAVVDGTSPHGTEPLGHLLESSRDLWGPDCRWYHHPVWLLRTF